MVIMKKSAAMVLVLVVASIFPACQKKHPVKVRVSPEMKKGEVASIAIFPFTSAVGQSDDPDNRAPRVFEKFFFEDLSARTDYKFITPRTVSYAAEREGVTKRQEEFLRKWPTSQEPDMEFLKSISGVLKCDAFLIGTIDLWQKDEADYQENAAGATYVGATITVIDAATGKTLFQASDEDYLESIGTETGDRRLVVGKSGNVYKDFGERMYKAPPFEDVVVKVAKALASSLPPR